MRWRWCASLLAAVLGWAGAGPLRAEPIEIELEMVMQSAPGQISVGARRLQRRSLGSQDFFHQVGGPQVRVRQPSGGEFSAVVRREPQYQAEEPLRQVAVLGGQDFAFVLDKKDRESDFYDLLYFDRNANGDLTDEEPIEVDRRARRVSGSDFLSVNFLPVDLELSAEGTQYPYRAWVSAVSYIVSMSAGADQTETVHQINISLSAACHREGTAVIDGVQRQFFLFDNNSDGRFDGFAEAVPRRMASGEECWSVPRSDWLLVDPDPADPRHRIGHEITGVPGQHYLSQLLHLDGKNYDLAVTPAGDRLTLTPSARPTGRLSSTSEELTAVFFGDQGVVTVETGPDRPIALPAGEWRLLNYTLDRTGKEDRGTEEQDTPREGWPLSFLFAAAVGGEPVQVVADETAALPMGPPYKAVAQLAPHSRGAGMVQLELAFIGTGGERVTNLMVAGGRPPNPTFEILGPDDEVVASGQFEYG